MESMGRLAELGRRLSLSQAEVDRLCASGVRGADGMHHLLTVNLAEGNAPPPILEVGRRSGVAAALQPLLSPAYREALSQRSIRRPLGASVPSVTALEDALEVKPPDQINAGLQGMLEIDL